MCDAMAKPAASPASTPSAFTSSVTATSYVPMFDGVIGTELMRFAPTITSIHAGMREVDAEGHAEEREHRHFEQPDRERERDRLCAEPRLLEHGEAIDEVRDVRLERALDAVGEMRRASRGTASRR